MISNRGRVIRRIGKYKVVQKPAKVMKQWRGMNTKAAKELHFKPIPPSNELWVDGNKHFQAKTAKHEYIESCKMKKGLKYKTAHKIAEKYENRTKKFILKKFK